MWRVRSPFDSEAIATDAGEVVSDAGDCIEGREPRYLMEGVRQEFGADRLKWSIAVGRAQDADAVGVLGGVNDQKAGDGRAAHALLPSDAHDDVAGLWKLSYFDWADGDGSCGSGWRWGGPGCALFGQLVEKSGCGHRGELLSVCRGIARSKERMVGRESLSPVTAHPFPLTVPVVPSPMSPDPLASPRRPWSAWILGTVGWLGRTGWSWPARESGQPNTPLGIVEDSIVPMRL